MKLGFLFLTFNSQLHLDKKVCTVKISFVNSFGFKVISRVILISIILGIVSIVSLPPASPNQATLHRLCDAGRRGSETLRG